MRFGSTLCFLLSASLCLAHPLDYEVLRFKQARSVSAFTTSSAVPTATITTAPTTPFDLANMLEGNKVFLEQKSKLRTALSETLPGVMFIGCSDNRLSPDAIFQIQTGSTVSHSNLGNQFTGKDPSANAAVANAVKNIGVQHIIVLGHYGCQSVHTAMATEPMDIISQRWLQPIADIFSRSRRPEIKKLLNARRWHDYDGAAMANLDASRALIEENVKAAVKNIQDKSLLSAYQKNRKTVKLNVFVYGLVLDEETGEVKDLGVSFGPPGQTIPKLPLEMIVIEKPHNSFGKFKPKAKKLVPTATSTVAASITSSSSITLETP